MSIKSWKARESHLGICVGAKREWVVRLKLHCIGDDAEGERDEEVVCDCLFPQSKASPGASPWKRTECEVRRDSFDVAESDAVHMMCALVSFKAAQRRSQSLPGQFFAKRQRRNRSGN